jgi:hypothetical protein
VRPEPAQAPALHLARLARGLTAEQARLFTTKPIEVPAAETDRFESELFPLLPRRVAIRSSERSVDLPEARPDIVVCTVTYRAAHAVEVARTLDSGRSLWDEWNRQDEVRATAKRVRGHARSATDDGATPGATSRL